MHARETRGQVFARHGQGPRTSGAIVTVRALLAVVGDIAMLCWLLLPHWGRRVACVGAIVAALALTAAFVALHQRVTTLTDHAFLPLAYVCAIIATNRYGADRAARPVWLLVGAAALLAGVISAVIFLSTINIRYQQTDFGIFYRAATAVWRHRPRDLYDLQGLADDPLLGIIYRQPPLPAVLIAPLSLLSFPTALFVWRALLIACVAAAIGRLSAELRLHAIGTPRGWPLITLAILTIVWFPLRDSLRGQWDAILLLLLVFTFIGLRHGRPPLVGITLALAGLIKVYPLYLGLFLLWKREWRALGWLLGSLVVLTGVGALVVGWETTARYFRDVFPQIGGSTTYPENQSLLALFLRLFQIEEIRGPDATLPSAICLLLVTAPLCWRLRAQPARTSTRYAIDFSLTICAMLLAIPVAWHHYETVLLLPVGVLLAARAAAAKPPLAWLFAAATAILFLAISQDTIARDVLKLPLGRHSYFDRTILLSTPVLAQIGLAATLWCARSADREPAASALPLRAGEHFVPVRRTERGQHHEA